MNKHEIHLNYIGMRRKNRIRYGSLLVDALVYAVALILALITLYPILFIISNSISDPMASAEGSVWLYPVGFSLEAYEFVFQSSALWRSFLNSIFYTIIITAGQVLIVMMCGFGLSKKGLLCRKGIVLYIMLPMWFSAGLIPSFINIVNLGMYNSLLAIFLPALFNIYNAVLARTFISKLPASLNEAALIDGASVPVLFFRIILPLSKPIIAVLVLYVALGSWNNWFSYMVYLPTRSELHPLQYFLVRTLIQAESASSGLGLTMEQTLQNIELSYILPQLKYATIVVATFPIMCLYPFVQKYFVQGVMLGSLKE